jgi:DNA-binding XRE family transcriptional regulator
MKNTKMKHLKTQQQLNEASENLNISDVRGSYSFKFNSNKLATDIKTYRDDFRLTNKEMCRVLGVTEETFSKILRTKLIPDLLMLNQICIVLNRWPGGRNIYSYIKEL